MLEKTIKNEEVLDKMAWINKNELVDKAKKANDVLNALGIASHTESGKQIRSALALELLGAEYDMVDKYSKAVFVKTQGGEVMAEVKKMLANEGILSTKAGVTQTEQVIH